MSQFIPAFLNSFHPPGVKSTNMRRGVIEIAPAWCTLCRWYGRTGTDLRRVSPFAIKRFNLQIMKFPLIM